MRFLLVLVFMCAQGGLFAKGGEALRVFLAGDAVTQEMKASTSADIEKMEKSLHSIAKQVKMKCIVQKVHGKEFTLDRLLDWAESLKEGKDTAVFYYSGRGRNLSESVGSTTKGPHIFLTYRGNTIFMSEEDVAHEIKKRNPRLILVLADCYEKQLGSPKKFSFKDKRKKLSKLTAGLKKLFLKSQGILVACSGEKVQNCYFSLSPQLKGGAFTSCFLKGLYSEASSKKASWGRVMGTSWKLCHKGQQDPLFGILVSDHVDS